jgi:hypothetical protein
MNTLDKIKWKLTKFFNPRVQSIIQSVREQKLTYLNEEALCELVSVAFENERKKLKGSIVETGCALGGSAIVLASVKDKARELRIYDVFDMIPPPSDKDPEEAKKRYAIIASGSSEGIGGDRYYGYQEDLYTKVKDTFKAYLFETEANNIMMIKGLFDDTLKVDFPVSLAHIDCDWYDPVMTCLSRIEPFLVSGGRFVIDDYNAWGGCKKAVDEFFKDKPNYQFMHKSRLHIVKK